jgi:hypothetical protein
LAYLARHVIDVKRDDTTFAKECGLEVARRHFRMRKALCRIGSIIQLLGVTSEF